MPDPLLQLVSDECIGPQVLPTFDAMDRKESQEGSQENILLENIKPVELKFSKTNPNEGQTPKLPLLQFETIDDFDARDSLGNDSLI